MRQLYTASETSDWYVEPWYRNKSILLIPPLLIFELHTYYVVTFVRRNDSCQLRYFFNMEPLTELSTSSPATSSSAIQAGIWYDIKSSSHPDERLKYALCYQ